MLGRGKHNALLYSTLHKPFPVFQSWRKLLVSQEWRRVLEYQALKCGTRAFLFAIESMFGQRVPKEGRHLDLPVPEIIQNGDDNLYHILSS